MKNHETEGRSLFSCETVTHRLCNHWLTEAFEKKKVDSGPVHTNKGIFETA